jgi:hypothetical protein
MYQSCSNCRRAEGGAGLFAVSFAKARSSTRPMALAPMCLARANLA